MDVIAIIAERKVSEAMARGEFDNLPGRGRPLRLEDDLPGVPGELRMAYRLLRNAGFVPPEVELRREIVSLRALLDSVEEDEELRRKRREFQGKLLKLPILLRRPIHLDAAEFAGDRSSPPGPLSPT